MEYQTQPFCEQLEKWNIKLSEKQLEQFISFYEELIETNKVMNLTAITEFEDVIEKHFIDSLALCNVIDLSGNLSLIDVGTGAGFPGIPLKIVFENLQITLLDSLNKRVNFLNGVIEKNNLKSIEAIHGRAEEVGQIAERRQAYDICVSRAVSRLAVLSELCIPFLKVGGKFISYKSGRIDEEIEEAKCAIHLLGGEISEIQKFSLPGSDAERSFVVISKVKSTPKRYPRRPGIPGKEPLLKR